MGATPVRDGMGRERRSTPPLSPRSLRRFQSFPFLPSRAACPTLGRPLVRRRSGRCHTGCGSSCASFLAADNAHALCNSPGLEVSQVVLVHQGVEKIRMFRTTSRTRHRLASGETFPSYQLVPCAVGMSFSGAVL